MNKPILLLVVIGVLVSGCAEEVEPIPTDNIYTQYPKVNRVLVDIAISENPVETARKTGRLAETQAEYSIDRPIFFVDGRLKTSVFLNNPNARFPSGYNVIEAGRIGDQVGIWIQPNQILELSNEPSVTEITLPVMGSPETSPSTSQEEMSYE